MAGDQAPGILGAAGTLERGFGEVAALAQHLARLA
jgi:hypothetical protein